ncbi:putative ABC1 transporter, partial [Leptomonas seymouri]
MDSFVLGAVEGASIAGRNGTELSYQLPSTSVDQFPALLNEIDSVEANGIRGYSLAATTLEEVFLKVSEEDLEYRKNAVSSEQLQRIWTCGLVDAVFWSQMKAMLLKRLWSGLRDRRMQCFQIVCPVLCIFIAMLLSLIKFDMPQELVLDYGMFSTPLKPVVLTRGCDELWGVSGAPKGTERSETHFQTGGMLSDFAFDTWYTHKEPRLGGVSCNEPTLVPPFVFTKVRNIHFVNTSSHHQGGVALATYYDQLVKHVKSPNAYIKHTAAVFDKPDPSSALTFIFVGILIMIPMSFLPSNAVAWVVKERECGSMHLQKISGLNYLVYWGANFIFDTVAYFISMILCLLIFAIFQRKEFVGDDCFGATFTIFLLYGLTSTVGAYAVSFLFNEHSSAQMSVMAVGLVLGFLLNIMIFVIQLDDSNDNLASTLCSLFRLIPSYSIGEGVIHLLLLPSNRKLGFSNGPWDMDELGWAMVYLAAEVPFFAALTLILDHPTLGRLLDRRRYHSECTPVIAPDEDPDVTEERNGVYAAEKSQNDSTDVVRVIDLQKDYGGGKLAVKGITFSIFPGEVFGFL